MVWLKHRVQSKVFKKQEFIDEKRKSLKNKIISP